MQGSSLGPTAVAWPFASPCFPWVCGQGSAFGFGRRWHRLYTAWTEAGRLGGGRGRLQAEAGALGRRGRRGCLAEEGALRGSWAPADGHGSAPRWPRNDARNPKGRTRASLNGRATARALSLRGGLRGAARGSEPGVTAREPRALRNLAPPPTPGAHSQPGCCLKPLAAVDEVHGQL